ncbi:MAG TPA: hypothetical protein VGJ20_25030 [Xanthobacteraceae bacterium]
MRTAGNDKGLIRGKNMAERKTRQAESGMVPSNAPRLARRLGKFVLEILPPASAVVIGGVVFIHHQFAHSAAMPATAAQVSPASATMLQLVRAEHATIGNFVKAQLAAEKSRDAAADRADAQAAAAAKAVVDAKAAADAKQAGVAAAPALPSTLAAAKSAESRRKPPVAATAPAPHAPLVIAQAPPIDSAPPVEAAASADSLMAKTLNLKEDVVAATRRAVAAISDLPTWIVSMGERIGGTGVAPSSPARMFSTSS